VDEARHFKFGLQIEHKEHCHYTCYKSAVWGCIQGHVTFVKFWEITTNIAKTVQNRDVVKMEDC